MAEIEKTPNYGLNIFDDTQTTLTFKEFRKLLAGIGLTEDDYSNMQKIDAVLKKCEVSIQNNLDASKNYTEEQIAAFKALNDKIIKDVENGNLVIGEESNKPIEFHDGAQISYLKDGVFIVNGIEVNYIRIVDYLLRFNPQNGHLQISYNPLGGDN